MLEFLPDAIAEIEDVYSSAPEPPVKRSDGHLMHRQTPTPNNIIDVHGQSTVRTSVILNDVAENIHSACRPCLVQGTPP